MVPQIPNPYVHSLRPKKRSGVPKVLGILAIVFSVFGLLFAAVQTFGTYSDIEGLWLESVDLGTFGSWIPTYMAFAVLVFGLHLTAGILSVRYSPRCIKWMNGYAVAALLLAVANITITALTYPEVLESSDGNKGRIALDVLAIPWPIVVLSLMNLRRTQDATSDTLNQKIPAAKIA